MRDYWRYDIRCTVCGKFCKVADIGAHYGGDLAEEQPDEEFFCESCVTEKLQDAERTAKEIWWYRPYYVRVAKAIMRHRKKVAS